MDWNAVVERNREALKRILAMLVAMAGLGAGTTTASPSPLWGGDRGGGTPLPGGGALPRHLHRAILALLRPAEAAARRLIIVAARDLVLPPRPLRKPRPKLKSTPIIIRTHADAGMLVPRYQCSPPRPAHPCFTAVRSTSPLGQPSQIGGARRAAHLHPRRDGTGSCSPFARAR